MDWLDSILDFVGGIGTSIGNATTSIGNSLTSAYNILGGNSTLNLAKLASGTIGIVEQLRNRGMSEAAINDAISNAKSVREATLSQGRSTYGDIQASNRQQLDELAPSAMDTYGTLADDILALSTQLHGRGIDDINEVGNSLDTIINARGGKLADEMGAFGSGLIDFAGQGADDQRRMLTPAIRSEAARFLAPDQYSDEGIRGVLGEQALRGVNDTYRNITDTTATQATRSGQSGDVLLAALAKQRAKDTSDALINAQVQSLGAGQKLNQERRAAQGGNISNLSTALANRENTMAQAYNVGGNMKLGSTQALMDALYKSKLGQLSARSDLNKALSTSTIGGTADAGRIGGTLYNTLLGNYGTQSDTNTRGLYSTINTAGNSTNDVNAGIAASRLFQDQRYDSPIGRGIGNVSDVLGDALKRRSKNDPYTGALGSQYSGDVISRR